MNRRGFLRDLLLGGAAFSILPGAGRIWKAQRKVPPWVMHWEILPYMAISGPLEFDPEYKCVMVPPPTTDLKSITTVITYKVWNIESFTVNEDISSAT